MPTPTTATTPACGSVQVVVVAVHRASSGRSSVWPRVAGRPALDDPVVLDECPRHVRQRRTAPIGMTSRPNASQSAGSPKPAPSRSQPRGGSAGGSSTAAGSSGSGGAASGPNPKRPAPGTRPRSPPASQIAEQAELDRRDRDRPDLESAPPMSPRVSPYRTTRTPAGDGRADGEPRLLPGPRDRMEHVGDHRDEDEPDHDPEEQVVAAGLRPRAPRSRCSRGPWSATTSPAIRISRPSALRGQDEDAERRRSRRRRPTSRPARSPGTAPIERHADREREPVAPAVARVEPQRGEDRVRADDAEARRTTSFIPIRLWTNSIPSTQHDQARRSPPRSAAGTAAGPGRTGTGPSGRRR